MLRISRSIIFLVLLFSASAFGFTPRNMGTPESIQPFYGDPSYFSVGKVFRFADQKNEGNNMYIWKKTEKEGSDWVLTTRRFDNDFNQMGEMQEILNDKGAQLLTLSFNNDGQKVETNVQKNTSMKWALKEMKKISWQVGYAGATGEETLRSDRLYHGFNKARDLEGKTRQVIKFTDYFLVKRTVDGEEEQVTSYEYVYLADGLGMIEFERNESGKWTDHFVMDQIMSLEEWETLKGQ